MDHWEISTLTSNYDEVIMKLQLILQVNVIAQNLVHSQQGGQIL